MIEIVNRPKRGWATNNFIERKNFDVVDTVFSEDCEPSSKLLTLINACMIDTLSTTCNFYLMRFFYGLNSRNESKLRLLNALKLMSSIL